jgi:hypothetical protein
MSFTIRYSLFLLSFVALIVVMVVSCSEEEDPAGPPSHPEVVELQSPDGVRCFLYDSDEHGSQRYGFSCVEVGS